MFKYKWSYSLIIIRIFSGRLRLHFNSFLIKHEFYNIRKFKFKTIR